MEESMNELLKVNYDSDRPTVSGRELHEYLEVETPYTQWFDRMCEYGFTENTDWMGLSQKCEKPQGGRPTTNHQLTITMAKELCMIQRNDKGKEARQYFIALETQWNTPEAVMSRALRMADRKIEELKTQSLSLQLINSRLTVEKQIMQPKAEYFDELVDRNLLTNFRETAKELKVGENVFINFLIDSKFVYRDKKGKLMPYAEKNKGLFEVKECFNEKTNWSGPQTLITPKGRETFRLLMKGLSKEN
jgi:anti-repressor protein